MKAVRLSDVLKSPPEAWAEFKKGSQAPYLLGSVRFHQWSRGVLIRSEFVNLPQAAHYQLKIAEESPEDKPASIRHLPKFYPDNGYSLFLFYSDQVTPEELYGKSIALLGPESGGAAPACISRTTIQSRNFHQ